MPRKQERSRRASRARAPRPASVGAAGASFGPAAPSSGSARPSSGWWVMAVSLGRLPRFLTLLVPFTALPLTFRAIKTLEYRQNAVYEFGSQGGNGGFVHS